jgi:hypothetical protein
MKKSRPDDWFDKKTSTGTQGCYWISHNREQKGFFHFSCGQLQDRVYLRFAVFYSAGAKENNFWVTACEKIDDVNRCLKCRRK